MSNYKRISIQQAKTLLEDHSATLADIRDQQSFLSAHIDNAFHLHNDNLKAFIAQTPLDKPLIVYCYHGNSSQGAGQFLAEQGFAKVYSMDGGFEEWRSCYPSVTD